jgi:hypothetical protein
MNRLSVLLLGVSVLAAGCGSESPSEPSPVPSTSTTTFTVALSPANEVPAVTNADAAASGSATIALTVTKDGSGAVTSATANIQISVAGFPADTTVTDAHIHGGAAGSNAGVVVNAGISGGALALTNGSGSITRNGINVTADRAAAILANPSGHYFNVHTARNPDGAIRGQLAGGVTTVGLY